MRLLEVIFFYFITADHDLDFEHYYYILLYYHYRYTDTLSFSMHQIIITLVYTMISTMVQGWRDCRVL